MAEARGVIDRTNGSNGHGSWNSQDWVMRAMERLKGRGYLVEKRGARDWLEGKMWSVAYRLPGGF